MKKEWECWDCGFILEQESKPNFCPRCQILHLMKNESFFIELPRSRKPFMDEESIKFTSNKNDNISKVGNQL